MCDRVRLAEHGKQTRCVRCATVSDWRGTGKQGVRCDRVRLTGHGKQTSCVRYVTVSDWRGTGKQAVSDTRPFRLAGHGKTSCPMCDRVRLAGHRKQASRVRYVTVSDWRGTGEAEWPPLGLFPVTLADLGTSGTTITALWGFHCSGLFQNKTEGRKVSEEKTARRDINRCTNGGWKGEKRTKKEH